MSPITYRKKRGRKCIAGPQWENERFNVPRVDRITSDETIQSSHQNPPTQSTHPTSASTNTPTLNPNKPARLTPTQDIPTTSQASQPHSRPRLQSATTPDTIAAPTPATPTCTGSKVPSMPIDCKVAKSPPAGVRPPKNADWKAAASEPL